MNTSLQTIHCVLENNPAWPACPLPYVDGANSPDCFTGDWEPLLTQYQKGDKRFFQLLCRRSQPLVDKISRKRFYVANLGREESYSIAAMSMVEFWTHDALKGEPKDLPRRLTQAINCDLLNQINRQKTRRNREIHYETSDSKESEDDWQAPPADNRNDPEQKMLQAEWDHKVRNCLQYLGKREQQVIQSFFFRQLSVPEIAREMHCTSACVSATKKNALYKLRRIFAEQHVV